MSTVGSTLSPMRWEPSWEADLPVIGGDVTTDGAPDPAAAAIELWRPLAPRLLAVAGNMDSPEIDERLSELGVALDARGYQLGSVGVLGVSAAPHSAAHPVRAATSRQGRLHDGARFLRRSRKERVSRPLS
jgi:Icc-related predicted phosphoesterase